MSEIKIAGIPFSTWIQLITTIATVLGAFSVIHTKLEVTANVVQELKLEIKELKQRAIESEKFLGAVPAELKYLDRRISDIETSRSNVQK